MSTKTTLMAIKRQKNQSIKEEIKTHLKIDEPTYFWVKVELGMAFLELHFPRGGAFEKYYIKFRNDPYFWAWWNLKWINHEAVIIKYFRNHPEIYDSREWQLEMKSMSYCNEVSNSFHHNYIKKSMHNV